MFLTMSRQNTDMTEDSVIHFCILESFNTELKSRAAMGILEHLVAVSSMLKDFSKVFDQFPPSSQVSRRGELVVQRRAL